MTNTVGKTRYRVRDINTYGELPSFESNLMWPLTKGIPLTTPPKGRELLLSKQNKRTLSSPSSSEKPKNKNLRSESSGDETNDEFNYLKYTFKKVVGKGGKGKKSEQSKKRISLSQ